MIINHMPITDPAGDSTTGENHQLGPNRETCTLHLPAEIGHPCNSANQKPPSPQRLLFSNRLSFRTTPPDFLHLLHNILFLFCLLDLAMVLP